MSFSYFSHTFTQFQLLNSLLLIREKEKAIVTSHNRLRKPTDSMIWSQHGRVETRHRKQQKVMISYLELLEN